MTRPVSSDGARSDTRRLARGGALNLVGAVVYGATNFGLVVIVTSQLGAEGTGELLLAIAAFNIGARIAELGAATGCVRFISRDLALGLGWRLPALWRTALLPVAVVGVAAGLVVWLAASVIGGWVADGSSSAAVADYLRVLAPFLPVAAVYSVAIQGSRGFDTMRPRVVVDRVVKPLVQVAAVWAVLAAGVRGSGLGLAWAAPVALATVPTAIWVRGLTRRAMSPAASPAASGAATAADRDAGQEENPGQENPGQETPGLAGEFWRFSLPRSLGQLFAVAVLWLDTLLIGALRSAEEAGVYAASTRYLLIGTFTAEAVMQVLGPAISRLLATRETGRAQDLFRTATAWQVCLVWPVYLVIALFAPVLLGVFGAEFRQGSTALVILSGGILVSALLGPADTVVLMAGRSSLSMFNGGVTFVVNVVGNLVLTPRYGIEGAAVAWAAAIVLSAALPAWQLGSIAEIRPLGGRAVVAAAATVGAVGLPCLAARSLLGDGFVGLVVGLAAAAVVAVPVAWNLRQTLGLDQLVASFRRA